MKIKVRLILCMVVMAIAGCGKPSNPTTAPNAHAPAAESAPPAKVAPKPRQSDAGAAQRAPAQTTTPGGDGKLTSSATGVVSPRLPAEVAAPNAQTVTRQAPPAEPLPDDDAVAAVGIRKLVGKHLTLYTDLPSMPAVDELPALFDQAYPQWGEYFGAEPANQPWRVVGCLIGDKQKFKNVGLTPADLPEFLHGYYRNGRLWLYEQSSDYYRRHLLLHEGTHAFTDAVFGACGPPWYMEGIAELLATHSLVDGKLTLSVFPARRENVPLWGRVKLVRDAIDAGRPLTLPDVLDYGATAHRSVEPYGWCWALAAFLDSHPRYRERFRKLPELVHQEDFNRRFRELFANDWAQLAEEWQVFAANLEYGYDFQRAPSEFAAGKPLPTGGATTTIDADRGWQSSGYELEAGKTYRLTASGRFQLAKVPRPWISETNGVSIRYTHGKPLGLLLGAVHAPPKDAQAQSPLAKPIAIGAEATLKPERTGTLYLRVNDSPAELADNAGKVEVRIVEE